MLIFNKQSKSEVYKPVFFSLKEKSGRTELEKFLSSNKTVNVLDEIESQLKELIKLRYPKRKLKDEELELLIKSHLAGKEAEEYGVWVYYPWLNKLIHLLDEDEFVEVRTNRNHYKITPSEEKELFKKKIGIIGLSVGKSIALTIALERICGELILADFDEIELSNLNRIQTGVQNFGVKKTIVVAREIAEIDPYLKVTCLHDGLTEDNVTDFFNSNNKLIDVCIEVCDGLYTKIFARQKAKELGVPVVMNSSDRGTTDIERYDLDPNLPILHGLIDHLDLTLLKEAKTNEEKVPYLLPMLGVKTSSNRLKASMLEIQETITTWPQLASGVVFGGGICTDVCRRLLLDQIKKSGRYFVDVEDLINDDLESNLASSDNEDLYPLIPNTSLIDYEEEINNYNEEEKEFNTNYYPSNKELETLIQSAIMAPSGGNIQPWKFIHKAGKLFLFSDANRNNSILNFNNNANLIGFGAATENLILKAKALNLEVKVDKLPADKNKLLIAVFYFTQLDFKIEHDDLVDVIKSRATNRLLTKSAPLSANQLDILNKSVTLIEGASLKLYNDDKKIDQIQCVLSELDRVYLTSKSGHYHFINEIRWSDKANLATKDGVDLATIDITPTEEAGLIVAKDWEVVKHSKNWNLGKTFGKLTKKAVEASASLGMLVLPKSDANCFYNGGRALERLWLTATRENIGFQPLSINTFLFERITNNDFEGIEEIEKELKYLAKEFYSICELRSDQQNVFFFRLFNGANPKVKSLRRDLKDVFING